MTVIPFDTLEFTTRDYLDTRLKETESRIRQTESRIITRLGGLMVMGFSILAVLIKVL